jgi:hypothetical protein
MRKQLTLATVGFERYAMNRHIMLVGKAAGRGVFKGAALVGAFVIIVAAWWWDASLLTAAADKNLQLIKTITAWISENMRATGNSYLYGHRRAVLDRARCAVELAAEPVHRLASVFVAGAGT